jgi:TetR/AcrR family acrAB operon transcriptional repressor
LARRTKEEALETRHKLLDAAERLFQEKGVSRTSLQDIARHAGCTRDAVYWHFEDKADLFNAMMERVTLPMEASFKYDHDTIEAGDGPNVDPLQRIRQATVDAFQRIMTDAQSSRVFEVATQKVGYRKELRAVRLRHLAVRLDYLSSIE